MDILKARDLVYELYDNTVQLILAKRASDESKINGAVEKEKIILEAARCVKEPFDMLLISGYKEMIFNSIDNVLFNTLEYELMKEYERIIGDEEIVRAHEHDPDHPVFDDDLPHNFNFYYEWEVYGNSILDCA